MQSNQTELKPFDFEQIQFVINQLSKAGIQQLYIPVALSIYSLSHFKALETEHGSKIANQYQKIGESEFLIELSQG